MKILSTTVFFALSLPLFAADPQLRGYSGIDGQGYLCELATEKLHPSGRLTGILRINGKNHELNLERGGSESRGQYYFAGTEPTLFGSKSFKVIFNSRGRALRYEYVHSGLRTERRECELDP